MFDVAITSDRVITSSGAGKAVLLIKDGKIAEVLPTFLQAEFPIIDFGNKVIMPGVIDPHVHINEPGRTEWEGFDTATKAAIAGGVTTLVDMPLNSLPVTTTAKAFDEKIRAARGQLHTHCGFWGGVVPGNEKEIEPLIEKGILGFKAFLTHSGIDEFPNVTENDLRKVMPIIAKYNLPLLVHSELEEKSRNQNSGNAKSYTTYLASRPVAWEDNAIALMIRLCGEYNCRVHIVHLSSSNSIEQIAQARQKGLPLTVETGQHYLYFNAENIKDGQTPFKCAPPIRDKENNEKLWQALKEGIIDFVATDHSPAPAGMKEIVSGDFMKAWGGISSIQFALPVLWTAAQRQGCNLNDMAKWLCEKPALLPGLKSKGKIAKGYDADLVVWDPDKKFVVTENIIQHKHKITPYLHEELSGAVEQTYLKGENVFNKNGFIQLNKGDIILR